MVTEADALSPEKRQQIIDGAASVFANDGYEGASMARIAAVANVSKGTLYNYFESKSALFIAYVEAACEAKLSHVFDGLGDSDDAASGLRQIGERMLQLMLSDVGITMNRMMIAEAAKFPDLARCFFEAGPAQAVRHMAEWLERSTARGWLAVSDPSFAAEQFFALCQTKLVQRRRLMLVSAPSPAEIERVVTGAVAMFLCFYATHPAP